MIVRDPTALTCQDVVELVTELLDDALEPEDRARIEQHLLVCPPCTMHVAQVRATIELARETRADDIPVEVGPSLIDAFRRSRAR